MPYEEQAALEVTPKPETIIRVMMLTQPLESKIDFPLQDLSTLKQTRKGFTVVEWGGSEIKSIIEKN
jgi:endoglucanase